MSFSKRVALLPTYPMAELPAIKRRLIEQGVDVIDVGAGDADFPPPEVAVKALTRALQDPAMSRYGFQLGLPGFRESAAAYMQRRFGVSVDPFKELHPLLGSKEGIAYFATAVLNPGDVAIVPVPGYAVYHGGTVLADAEPYLYNLTPRTDFLLELDEIPRDVLKRTKLVYLNYPNNPTAAVAPREYLERVIAACRKHDLVLAYDNPYCEVTFDGYVAPSVFEIPGAMDVAVEFHSLSKSFCMTGWRLGGARRPDRRARARQELRRHRRVPGGAGGRRRSVEAGRAHRLRLCGTVQGTARCDTAGAARQWIRGRDPAGDAVRVDTVAGRTRIGCLPEARARGRRCGNAAGERVWRGRGRIFPHRADGANAAAHRSDGAAGKGARHCLIAK